MKVREYAVRLGLFSVDVIKKRFGSWSAAKAAALAQLPKFLEQQAAESDQSAA